MEPNIPPAPRVWNILEGCADRDPDQRESRSGWNPNKARARPIYHAARASYDSSFLIHSQIYERGGLRSSHTVFRF